MLHVIARIVQHQRASQVGELFIGVAERIPLRKLLQRVIGQHGFEMLQRDNAVKTSSAVEPSNVATPTELSNTSWSKRRCAGWGVISSRALRSRRS